MNKSEDDKKRDTKRKNIRKAKKLASIDDPDKLKKEMRGLKTLQKRKIKRIHKRIQEKELKKRRNKEERLSRSSIENNNTPNSKNSKDKSSNNDTKKSKGDDTNTTGKNGVKKVDKVRQEDVTDRLGRAMLKVRIKLMKAKNKVKKGVKYIVSLAGFGWLSVIVIGILVTFIIGLLSWGTIVAITLSHPEAIKELHEVGRLGNALNLGNVSDDVTDDEGNVLVEGRDGTTGNNFDWYGVAGDGSGERSSNAQAGGSSDSDSSNLSPGTLVGNQKSEQIWNYFKSHGYSNAATAGIMGNLMQESTLSTTAVNPTSGATGIAQWLGARLTMLRDRASEEGVSYTDLKFQLDFLVWEFEGGETTTVFLLNRDFGGLETFKNTNDIEYAAKAFHDAFERAGPGAHYERRNGYARDFYNEYAN